MIEWGAVMDHAIFLNHLSKVGLAVSTDTLSPAIVPTLTSFPINLSFYRIFLQKSGPQHSIKYTRRHGKTRGQAIGPDFKNYAPRRIIIVGSALHPSVLNLSPFQPVDFGPPLSFSLL